MLQTVALFSSSRRHGNTGAVLDRVAEALKIDVIDLSFENISPYDYSHCNRDDGFESLIDRILGYEQIIFAAPVYWYAVPPPMKTFIDRLSDLLELADLKEKRRRLRGKRAYVVATSGVDQLSLAFISMFEDTFAYLGMNYRGVLHVNCDGGYRPGADEEEIQSFIAAVRHAN